jgi:hypothetical protein
MLNVQVAESLISIITFVCAYAISVTAAGCFASWFAYQMGDETAVESGFYTLNPLMHMDIVGTLFLVLYSFGWSRYIPINPFNIHGHWRVLKIAAAFLAEPVAYLLLGSFALVGIFAIFGPQVPAYFPSLVQAFPAMSSYSISIGAILIAMLYINMMLAVITMLTNLCGMGMMYLAERNPEYIMYTGLAMALVPMLCYFIFRFFLISAVFWIIKSIGFFLASLFSLL